MSQDQWRQRLRDAADPQPAFNPTFVPGVLQRRQPEARAGVPGPQAVAPPPAPTPPPVPDPEPAAELDPEWTSVEPASGDDPFESSEAAE